jgi:hypothetical protein
VAELDIDDLLRWKARFSRAATIAEHFWEEFAPPDDFRATGLRRERFWKHLFSLAMALLGRR